MAKKKTPVEPTAPTLLDALKFVNAVQQKVGTPAYRHTVLYGQWAYGTDGVLSAGHKIEEDIMAAPHTATLMAALARADGHHAMTQLNSGISITAGRFRAVVPCHTLQDMPPIVADPVCAPIDDRVRAALSRVGILATDGAQNVTTACVRLGPGTATATNRHVVMEAWHGVDLPVMLLPKRAVLMLESIKKPLARFGYSGSSATFYFEDESWIKTQLYEDKYPDVSRVLDKPSEQWPITAGLVDALKAMEPFVTEGGFVYFSKNLLHTAQSQDVEVKGGSYQLEGLPEGRCFSLRFLLMLEGVAKTVDYGKGDDPLRFYGDNIRGAIAPVSQRTVQV